MRMLLINVPHPSIGSRIPDDHLPPLGLLSIGGPLIDAGHEVRAARRRVRADAGRRRSSRAGRRVRPDAVLFGHSGSTSAPSRHRRGRAGASRRALPGGRIVYGGVFPTYHWRDILAEEPHVDAIVRGEGEETARRLSRRWSGASRSDGIPGIAFRDDGRAACHARRRR